MMGIAQNKLNNYFVKKQKERRIKNKKEKKMERENLVILCVLATFT